jgi:cytochrome c
MVQKPLRISFLFCSLVFLASCILYSGCTEKSDKVDQSSGDTDKKPRETTGNSDLSTKGKELFYMTSTETGLACADCHSDGTNNANPLTKFFSPVNGVPERISTYHGMFTGEEVKNTAGGSTLCWERYLEMPDKMTPEQISSLNAYFESISTDNDPKEIVYETLALPEKDKDKFKQEREVILGMKGDAINGEKLFNEACAFCHSAESKVNNIPNLQEYEGDGRGVIYNTLLGDEYMPFYHKDKLSYQGIADISEFIMTKVVKK